jgi:hypothetical protein
MTQTEQHQLIQELRELSCLMKGKDLYDFEMFAKRDKDDEDLDELSRQQLIQLLEKYKTLKPKRKIKNPFE